MQIWVDADACPKVIKETLFRAAERMQVATILVANQYLQTPNSSYIKSVRVDHGFDVADNYIVQNLEKGDLVITADIPLAAEVIEGGAMALNPRGELYSENNIRQRLAMRNFMEEMRSAGQISGGPPTLSQTERREFANQLDRILAKIEK
ncbi:MAG: YaiI/YqxD family protein [Gammaproteobacteria bacterium]|nr:YaiI/YqxD family protein [Gammaproteobacteria bacterium]